MKNKSIVKLKLDANKRFLKIVLANLTPAQKWVIKDMKEHFKTSNWNLAFDIYCDMLKLSILGTVLLLKKFKFEPYLDKKTNRLMIRKIK